MKMESPDQGGLNKVFEAQIQERVADLSSKSKLTQRNIPTIAPNDVQINCMFIGRGSFSNVHRVRIQKHSTTSAEFTESKDNGLDKDCYYALKCLDEKVALNDACPCSSHQDEDERMTTFLSAATDLALEADILSRLDHSNIIQLHGVSTGSISSHFHATGSGTGYFLLLDLLEDTLASRILRWKKERETPVLYRRSSLPSSTLFYPQRKSHQQQHHQLLRGPQGVLRHRLKTVAIGIVKGIEYIHSCNIVLRDLKPENIGFDREGTVKIFDFGFARESHSCSTSIIAGSARYMAPEYLRAIESDLSPDKIHVSSDIYSFGLLLWEMCTLSKPYSHVKSQEHLINTVLHKSWRPSLRLIPSQSIRSLIRQCWDATPSKRPTASSILECLEAKVASLLPSNDDPQEQQKLHRNMFLSTSFRRLNKNYQNDNGNSPLSPLSLSKQVKRFSLTFSSPSMASPLLFHKGTKTTTGRKIIKRLSSAPMSTTTAESLETNSSTHSMSHSMRSTGSSSISCHGSRSSLLGCSFNDLKEQQQKQRFCFGRRDSA